MSMRRYNTNYYDKETDKDMWMVEKVLFCGRRLKMVTVVARI